MISVYTTSKPEELALDLDGPEADAVDEALEDLRRAVGLRTIITQSTSYRLAPKMPFEL